MRAIQVTRARAPFELVERAVPEPGPRQVRLRVEACGICHSDAFVRERSFPGVRLPRVPGHEVAGVIDALGEGVTAWRVGDRVGVGWHGGHCGTCPPCRRGDFVSCKKAQITGISFDGGYADYVVVPEVAPARIPDGLEAAHAGPLLCAGVTTYNALRHSGARPGDTVAIQGLGGLGHLGVQFAHRMGFRTVALSRGPEKADLAAQLGAHHYVDTAAQDPSTALQKLGGADVILATAPSAAAIGSTFGGLAPRGTLMVVGASPDTLDIPAFSLLSGKSVRGWPSGSAADSEDTMRFAALTGIRPMIEKFQLDQAEEAYARMIGNHARFRAVLLT